MAAVGLDTLRIEVAAVNDPELPPLTLADLGILRSVEADDDGTVVVTIAPTYSGCPALEYIEGEIAKVLRHHDGLRFRIERALNPPWTTDWITDDGRRKLREIGIAPPGPADGPVAVSFGRRPAPPCPRCGSTDTEEVSRFGSTACKALHRCRSCTEPFDAFKAI